MKLSKQERNLRKKKTRDTYAILNRDKYENNRLLKTYGITLEQYNTMYEEQKGCCSICGIHQNDCKIKLAVDHYHTTGKVRGLLCMKCNQGIGRFNDSISTLQSAILYLERAKECLITDSL